MVTGDGHIQKRFCELADKAERDNHYFYTGFLNLAEQSLFQRTAATTFPHMPWQFWGGYGGAERQMAALGGPELFGYDPEFPLACLEIAPLQAKFPEPLSHRDFLGALLNLGISRTVLGDIVIVENTGYLYCQETIVEYIQGHLERIKHRAVGCQRRDKPLEEYSPQLKCQSLVIASERLDALVAAVFNLSRGRSTALFHQEKIFVNGKAQPSPSALPKAGDLVSVRGLGRFYYDGPTRETKKGRKAISVRRFI